MTRIALCTAIVLLSTSSLRGDLPLPPNVRYVDPVVKFEGIAKLPDYTFRLRFMTFSGGPSGSFRYLPVSEGKAFNLNASRRIIEMQLLGLKRDEFERREKEDSTLRWLTDKTPDVLAADVAAPSTTNSIDQPVPVTSYLVSLRDGKLAVERGESPKKVGAAPSSATWISGVALALAFTAIGVRAFRARAPQGG